MKYHTSFCHRLAWSFVLLSLITGCDTSKGTQSGKVVTTDDPIVVDFPIAYIERPLPVDDDGIPVADNVLAPDAFNPGAQLVLKERATTSALETVLTGQMFPNDAEGNLALYDVKDLAVSYDGTKLLFALRAPELENVDEEDQPTWNLWEYLLTDQSLTRLIASDTIAGLGDDVSPTYLADGRVMFSSNRQRRTKAISVDEGKPQYSGLDDKQDNEAFVLHLFDPNASSASEAIQQISYNASHDLQPTTLASGEVVYLRWDAINNKNALSLYKINPDGTQVQLWYGYDEQDTGTNGSEGVFTQVVERADGQLIAILRPRETLGLGGDIIAIDAQNYTDINSPTPDNAGATNPGQQSLTQMAIDTEGVLPSEGGLYNSAYPLHDGTGRFLVSWSQCLVIDPVSANPFPCTEFLLSQGATLADPTFGLWIYDPTSGTQRPVKLPKEGVIYEGAVALAPKTPPAAYNREYEPKTELIANGLAEVHIRNVYDIDGQDTTPNGIANMADPAVTPTDAREVRFIRLVKGVPIPDDLDDEIFGVSDNQLMRDILGYIPVEPDGSAKFTAPADMPIMMDLVDATGKRIGRRHENWLTFRPGEQFECQGCHEAGSNTAHGRQDAQPSSAYTGATDGVNFSNNRLLDEFNNPELPPSAGQTMAEYYASLAGRAPRAPSVDILFSDEWTDPAAATPGADITTRYIDIHSRLITPGVNNDPDTATNPADANCPPLDITPAFWFTPTQTSCMVAGGWTARCRITINYQQSIHPLWEADRRVCDSGGNVISDTTCIGCHTRGTPPTLVIPAGQLELTGETSLDDNDFITSYVELLSRDNALVLIGESLADTILEVDTGEILRDENGTPILDENGHVQPIINQQTVQLPRPMSPNGARASDRFFSRFEAGGTHAGYLTAAELKLIAEWLDIGAQYYNDPFAVPAD